SRLPILGRVRPRAALRGHAGHGRRGVRAGGRSDPRDRRRAGAGPGLSGPDQGPLDLEQRLAAASRALVLGIGGGGDAVGALAVARRLEERGVEFVLGGIAWERFAVDPYPGPRPIAQIEGGERLGETALLVDPDEGARTPEGVHFCES